MSKKRVLGFLAILISILTISQRGMGVDTKTARLIDQEIQKHKTEIILSNIKLNQDLPDEEFTKRAIQRGGR